VELLQLPVLLDSIEDLAFDPMESNVFYAVGLKNLNFETQQTPNIKSDSIRLEKFFIEADSFSSKTLAHLTLPEKERVLSFTFSKSLQKVAAFTSSGALYVFSDWRSEEKPVDQASGVLGNVPTYEESKATMHTKEFQFKDSIPTAENLKTIGEAT